MKSRIYAGMLVASSLLVTIHCGSDDSDGGDDTTGSGGSGGSAASGGSSSGGTNTSGGGSAGESTSNEPVACPDDILDMPTALAESICSKRLECCQGGMQGCMTEVVAALEDIYPGLATAENEATASLDCDAFDACALAIHDASCNEWPLQSGSLGGLPVAEPACFEIITPTATDGETCRYNYQCIHGVCRVPENETDGTCDEFANLNASCDDVCDPATMFCNESNVCQSRLPNGASCTDDGECESRVCDTEGSAECVAPGPEHCEYVPNGAAHCAVAGAPGSRHTPYGIAALVLLTGLGAGAARRRAARGLRRRRASRWQ